MVLNLTDILNQYNYENTAFLKKFHAIVKISDKLSFMLVIPIQSTQSHADANY